jgi:hypothetical protein
VATSAPPPAAPAAAEADEADDKFDFGFSGPEGEFNFTKFLDDPPKPDAPSP